MDGILNIIIKNLSRTAGATIVVAALSACALPTAQDIETTKPQLTFSVKENYQTVFRRLSLKVKECQHSPRIGWETSSELFPDLGYGEITLYVPADLLNKYSPIYRLRVVRDANTAKVQGTFTARNGNPREKQLELIRYWAEGGTKCNYFGAKPEVNG